MFHHPIAVDTCGSEWIKALNERMITRTYPMAANNIRLAIIKPLHRGGSLHAEWSFGAGGQDLVPEIDLGAKENFLGGGFL
jgi:hypothetical protein